MPLTDGQIRALMACPEVRAFAERESFILRNLMRRKQQRARHPSDGGRRR